MIELTIFTLFVVAILFVAMGPKPAADDKEKPPAGEAKAGEGAPGGEDKTPPH